MFGVVNEGMRTIAENARDTDNSRAICANAGVPDEAGETLSGDDDATYDVFMLRSISGDLSAA
jgi:hypothetical protein